MVTETQSGNSHPPEEGRTSFQPSWTPFQQTYDVLPANHLRWRAAKSGIFVSRTCKTSAINHLPLLRLVVFQYFVVSSCTNPTHVG
jgi:hypothetical protein